MLMCTFVSTNRAAHPTTEQRIEPTGSGTDQKEAPFAAGNARMLRLETLTRTQALPPPPPTHTQHKKIKLENFLLQEL